MFGHVLSQYEIRIEKKSDEKCVESGKAAWSYIAAVYEF